MAPDSRHLRQQADHCRRLAKLLSDEEAVSELQRFAATFEAEAERLEAENIKNGELVSAPAMRPAAMLQNGESKEDGGKTEEGERKQ